MPWIVHAEKGGEIGYKQDLLEGNVVPWSDSMPKTFPATTVQFTNTTRDHRTVIRDSDTHTRDEFGKAYGLKEEVDDTIHREKCARESTMPESVHSCMNTRETIPGHNLKLALGHNVGVVVPDDINGLLHHLVDDDLGRLLLVDDSSSLTHKEWSCIVDKVLVNVGIIALELASQQKRDHKSVVYQDIPGC